MKILVVGSGGREHAITWRLAQDAAGHELFCAPGNAGTAACATNLAMGAEDIAGIVAWAEANRPDLVVVGPEAPLVKGLVDALQAVGITAFGPVAAGARMEGSKRFAKEIMDAAGVPTGKAETFTDAAAAKAALPSYGLPVVIKADGLAAGKGVVVAETAAQAEAAIDDMLVGNKFGAAGAEVLIEEFLHGEECSILALVDGNDAVLLPSSQDHKRVFDGDKGPNTGGMGAYSPAPVVTADKLPLIKEKIIMPVVRELARRGIVYRGILYAGLMVNDEHAHPHGPLAKSGLKPGDVVVKDACAATVIMASGGYPGSYEKGKVITGLENNPALVFHCGTKMVDGRVVTAGGRVLSVTGLGANLREAVDNAYAGVDRIAFDGAFHRTDIAHRAFARG